MAETKPLVDAERTRMFFDPAHPDPSFFSTATEMAAFVADSGVAAPVVWPVGYAPTLDTPSSPPDPSAPLPKVDVVIVTWTSAEASTVAALMTPGMTTREWYEYKSNVAAFIPEVTGVKAPFNDNSTMTARYYHSLGLYYPIQLSGRKVLCLKSGLHMDYDGPALPIVDFWKQVIRETGCQLIITTGTGGAVGANVLLGDVVIADHVAILCKKQFQPAQFPGAPYPTSPPPANLTALLTSGLLTPNAQKVAQANLPFHPDKLPAFFTHGSSIPTPTIVTTDFFGFDNTTDTNGLQALGNACEMGDVSLGLAISQIQNPPKWAAIRNASDPQVPGDMTPQAQDTWAGNIYKHYGGYTTAASVLASWAYICQTYPRPAVPPAAVAMAAVAPAAIATQGVQLAKQRALQLDPAARLLQIAASRGFVSASIAATDAPEAVASLNAHLASMNVDPTRALTDLNSLTYEDEAARTHCLVLAHVAVEGTLAFRGSYLFDRGDIVARSEFLAS
ncbi:phosphorylase family protein [Paraburkholderia fungorum]|uniref:phosphorylase family protein n=1 Tax=Paraburkholderia fungorum TaxID=134537 RepID=UPI0038B95E01